MGYEWLIALRYLRSRRKSIFISITTFFTAVGVMIGVAALIITLAVMSGFEDSLRTRVLSMTPDIQVMRYGGIGNHAAVEKRALAIRGVIGADSFIVGQAMLTSPTGARGVVVRGIDPANSSAVARITRFLHAGALSNLMLIPPAGASGPSTQSRPLGEVALGTTLAEKLSVRVGSEVRLISPIVSASGQEITATSASFSVGAVFAAGVQFIDDNLVLMDLPEAQAFFGRPGRVDGIELRLANLDATPQVTDAVRQVFQAPYRVRNWMQISQAASAGFAMLKVVYSLVLMLLIGVAAFNLIAMLIMVVMEKRKDIAILMTMGATGGAVRRIFIIKGVVIGTLGMTAGLMLGAVGCAALERYHFIRIPKDIYGMATLPVSPSVGAFVGVGVAAVALCFIATLYPARQAARQLPVEIIRWE